MWLGLVLCLSWGNDDAMGQILENDPETSPLDFASVKKGWNVIGMDVEQGEP